MTSRQGLPPDAVTTRARAEAAAWLAKLHGPERTAQMEACWRVWLNEHPERRSAWELAIECWGDTSNLTAVLPHRRVPGGSRRPRSWLLKPAITAAVFCLAVLGWVIHDYYASTLTTTVGEQRTLNLADGTRIELNTNSRLVLHFDAHARKVVLSSGEAYFAVAHERRPFIVEVGDRKVIAVGTSFLVRHDVTEEEPVSVTLIEGRVAIASAAAPNILPAQPGPDVTLLSAGYRWTKMRYNHALIDAPSMDKQTAWRRGQLIFERARLSEAVSEFNRYNAVQIKIASRQIGDLPVGGIFRTGDAASFAALVADAHHLRLTRKDQEILLDSAAPDQGSVGR